MAVGKVISILIFVPGVMFSLFEVDFVLDLGGSVEKQVPDPAIEAAYQSCYQARDDEIHATAFGTIDNPDVQKEYITSQRTIAARECREDHPLSMVIVETPGRFNIVDLSPRFW